MAPLTLYLLLPLLSFFARSSANKEEIVYQRNVHYLNMLPEYADVNMTGFSDIGLVECSMKCLVHTCTGHTNCVGVFHNIESQSCKLMSDNLVEGLSFQLRTGWEFFSVNRKYLIIFFFCEFCSALQIHFYLSQVLHTLNQCSKWSSSRIYYLK